MSNGDNKIITGICPFQTQLGQLARADKHAQLLLGPQQVPLLKLSCDGEKCQLWSRDYKMCAVSAIPYLITKQLAELGNLKLILAHIADIRPGKPTPSGGDQQNPQNVDN